jgi:hypothetical protein
MAEKTEVPRCNGCGAPLEPGDEVVRIAVGTIQKKGFKEKREWGTLHVSPCFNISIASPDAVMDEVRRQSESVGG